MHILLGFKWSKVISASALVIAVFGLGLNQAQAILINFDDITRVPPVEPFPCFCDHPVSMEWSAKGLEIGDGFLIEHGNLSKPNALLGGNYLTLAFVGALPTFVSMYVSSPRQDVVYLHAKGKFGGIAQKQTQGWAGPHDDTPYTDNQFISFSSALGISSIHIHSFFNRSTSAIIDDLTLEYASLPEPTPLMLFGVGLLAIIGKRQLVHKRLAAHP